MTGAKRHGTGQPDGDADSFDVTLRGYDRRQVDDRLAHLGAALAAADEALAALRSVAGCGDAAEIGEVRSEPPGLVLVETGFGGRRVMDLLVGDPLPRIC